MVDQLIQQLWDYGYFFSPDALAIASVEEKDLFKLSRTDSVVVAAVRKYQEVFQPTLDDYTQLHHSRDSIADGITGPATEDLVLRSERCGCPDFTRAGREEARFPDACMLKISTSYRMSLSGLSDDKLELLWKRADQNWADVTEVDFVLMQSNYPNTNIHSFKAALSGSVLADQYLSNGNCGDKLQGRFDNRTWSEPLFLATCTHEHGHALGLQHITSDRDAIMYPSIHQNGMNRGGKPNNSDINQMVRLGYKKRTTKPDKPDKPTGEILATVDVSKVDTIQIRSVKSGGGGWNL